KTVYVVMSRPCAPWVTELDFSTSTFKKLAFEMDKELMEAISDYYWSKRQLPSKRNIIKNFRKSNKTAGEALRAWQSGQSSELDEKATELLTELLNGCGDPIKMSVTYSEFGIDWRFTMAISEAIH